MKFKLTLFVLLLATVSCKTAIAPNDSLKNGLMGNWQLISSVHIKSGKTVVNVINGQKMIKIITDKYFAFLLHDVKEKDTAAKSIPIFSAGGGSYTLGSNKYTEHLEYCSARNYEGDDVSFNVELRNDTLILSGVEKLKEDGNETENANLVEKYVRIKD